MTEIIEEDQKENRPKFGQRVLSDEKNIYEENAWDRVEWDEELVCEAHKIVEKQLQGKLCEQKVVEYEEKASQFWDEFYGKHENRFFKDRNWLFTEFPELLKATEAQEISEAQNFQIFEIGCGVGNSIFPLLKQNKNPNLFIHACDFSPNAIQIVQNHELYNSKSCSAFCCDISSHQSTETIPLRENSIDIAILIFVLSAISPEQMQNCISRISKLLKPGGRLLFRDYGRFDLAQLRFKNNRCLGENFYVRGDGTRVYFFSQDEIRSLFSKAGLCEEENILDRRLIVNRGKKLKMYRSWVQAKYMKPFSA
eukprot:Sdes_comp20012_c0_seq1m12696